MGGGRRSRLREEAQEEKRPRLREEAEERRSGLREEARRNGKEAERVAWGSPK